MSYTIAIVDASGVLGHEIFNILAESDINIKSVVPLTTKKMSGREISFGDVDMVTKDMDTYDFKGTDIVFVAGYAREAKSIIQNAISAGVRVIDCLGVSLFDDIKGKIDVIPSATTLQLMDALKPIHDHVKIKRVVITTFEAVSGEGKDGMDELFNQSRKFFVSDGLENNVFPKQITFNTLPQVGEFMDDGQTKGEWTLSAQMKKCMDKNIKITATCVHVPVFIGHGMAVNIECEGDIDAKTARGLWRADGHTIVIDEASEMEFVTPAEISGEDHVYISRIRDDSTLDNGLSFWCVADNIRHVAVTAVNKIAL